MNKSSPKVKKILSGGLIEYDTNPTEEENGVLVKPTPKQPALRNTLKFQGLGVPPDRSFRIVFFISCRSFCTDAQLLKSIALAQIF
jgi:hypothetical protein